MKNRLQIVYLILVSMWFGWTVLVDFFVVPSVFAQISNFFEAGHLGVTVFTKLNKLELIVSLMVCSSLLVQKKYKTLIPALVCTVIVLYYVGFLSEKIRDLTVLWQEADSKGVVGLNGIPDVQQSHQFYHKLYITLDSVKLFLLLTLLGLGFFRPKEYLCEN